MKTTAEKSDPNVRSARASLAVAREFVAGTRSALAELKQRRTSIAAELAALAARPTLWTEVVDEAVAVAIDDCAGRYKPALAAWIRTHNPNLAGRGSYDDLPFLGSLDVIDPGVLVPALCYSLPDLMKPKLRALLLEFAPPFPSEACVSGKDREAQRAALDAQLLTLDSEIAQLQGELDQLKG